MIKRLDERSEGFFVFIWQFSADLKRSTGCQQSIFFSHINEQTFFPSHFIEQTIFRVKFVNKLFFNEKKLACVYFTYCRSGNFCVFKFSRISDLGTFSEVSFFFIRAIIIKIPERFLTSRMCPPREIPEN